MQKCWMMSGLLFELAVRKKSSNVSVLVIVMPIVGFILLATCLSCLCWRLRRKHGKFSSVIDSDCLVFVYISDIYCEAANKLWFQCGQQAKELSLINTCL